MEGTGTMNTRPLSSVSRSSGWSTSAVLTISVTSSRDWLDSNAISRATFCTPILTSTMWPFVWGAERPPDGDHPAYAKG